MFMSPKEIISEIDKLDVVDLQEVLSLIAQTWCPECGAKQTDGRCQCWNDE